MTPASRSTAEPAVASSRLAGRSLKGRALQWLSQREHSRAELRRKLLPHAIAAHASAGAQAAAAANAPAGAAPAAGHGEPHDSLDPAACVEAVLDWLQAHRYLSNERFVESRVHVRAGKFGNLRIRQELGRHQLALPADVAQALSESELARAGAVRERKFAAWPVNVAERAKQARFLAGRGFSPEVVGRLLRRCPGGEANRPDPADAVDELAPDPP